MMKSTIQTKRKDWEKTKQLLESLTPEQLSDTAEQAQQHKPITDKAVKELLKMVSRVGGSSPGSAEKKWYMYQIVDSLSWFTCHISDSEPW